MIKLFGTDGIRGEANVDPMTPDMALRLGRALAARVSERSPGEQKKIVIGKDTRLSGYIFEQALAAGICSMGVDVWLSGPLPTPGIAFITQSMRANAGVVISASHNPYYDNGIKLFGPEGFKLPDSEEDLLAQAVEEDTHRHAGVRRNQLGKAYRIDEAWARYVVFLKTVLPGDLQLDGMRIVVDCGHGAAYRVAPAVFSELGARVIVLGDEPDGMNINEGCGSLYPERMCEAVRQHGAVLGISLDGDADRVIVSDERGHLVDGDQLMAVCGLDMKSRGTLREDTVVATVMSNLGMEIALRDAGINVIRTGVGDRHVVDAMRRGGYNLGGEQSGHLIFLDHTSTGDGVVASLKALTVMLRTGKPLSELASCVERVPQFIVNVQVAAKPPIDSLPEVVQAIQDAEKGLGESGRVLVRYSGTESKARVMVEGFDPDTTENYANQIAQQLEQAVGA